jgi:predicted  nucleic acid-binding Zn-ribbon protein
MLYTTHMGTHQFGDERKCTTCGKPFRPRKEAVKQGPPRGMFCSRGCAVAFHNHRRRKHFERACAWCGKQFQPIREKVACCCRSCGRRYSESKRTPDPMVKVRHRMAVFSCGLIARCLRSKTDVTRKLLGYSTTDLITHIEAQWRDGMTWENYGRNSHEWSIDHIRPIADFPPDAELSEINALDNLRPLWVPDNSSKRPDRGER